MGSHGMVIQLYYFTIQKMTFWLVTPQENTAGAPTAAFLMILGSWLITKVVSSKYEQPKYKKMVIAYTGFAGGLNIFLRKIRERGLADISEQ